MKSLGLNFQGVDVILDQMGHPYYLEVQPGFSVGYSHIAAWEPPFYNPSRPKALVNFLKRDLEKLRGQIPLYVNYWLDKYNMFDAAYGALHRDLYERTG